MFEIDKKKFGAFVAGLRKEKGYTQRELAQKLHISDKAVSKWETGVSFPDTALLIPLAELFGVSVTELLMCERMEKAAPIDPDSVESIVKTAIAYPGETAMRAFQVKSVWPILYPVSVAVGVIAAVFGYAHSLCGSTVITVMVLGAVFGGYFCFFVKAKLPSYYDENRCGLYCDGFFRMNIAGLALNNSNWPHIVRVGRVWSCLSVALYPILSVGISCIQADLWKSIELYVCLLFTVVGLFVPIYAVGKKYE